MKLLLPFTFFFNRELRYMKLGSRSACHSVFIELVSFKVSENLVYCRLWAQILWAETPQINVRPGELCTLQWIEIRLNTICMPFIFRTQCIRIWKTATISVGFCFPTLLFNLKRHCIFKFPEKGMRSLCFSVKKERMGEKLEKSCPVTCP